MAFSINEFSSKLNLYGGLARPNIFEVEILPSSVNGFPNNVANSRSLLYNLNLKYFCQTVTFPGLNVEVFDYRPNTIDMARSMPRAIGHGDLECVFMVDDQHSVMELFHLWMRTITNYSDNARNDQLPNEIGYKSDYSANMNIKMYSKSPVENFVGATYYECKLTDVYPVQVGSVTLEWSQNESYMTLPVSFSYSKYEMRKYKNGQLIPNLLDLQETND